MREGEYTFKILLTWTQVIIFSKFSRAHAHTHAHTRIHAWTRVYVYSDLHRYSRGDCGITGSQGQVHVRQKTNLFYVLPLYWTYNTQERKHSYIFWFWAYISKLGKCSILFWFWYWTYRSQLGKHIQDRQVLYLVLVFGIHTAARQAHLLVLGFGHTDRS